MPYIVEWAGLDGARHKETAMVAKIALLKRVELLGAGYAALKVRDESGSKLSDLELARLMVEGR